MSGKSTSWASRSGVFVTLFFFCCSPSITYGSGIVMDPTAYIYYAEQIAQYSQQITEMKEMVATAEETLDTIDDVKKSVEKSYSAVVGSYNRGKRFVERFSDLAAMFEENPRTLEGQYNKWMNIGREGLGLTDDTLDLFLDPEKQIDNIFVDPRSSLYNHLADLDKRFQIRQTSLKNSIAKSTSLLAGTADRLDKAEELSREIDHTDNIKDAQDLTNAFLAEMLIVLNELLKLTAHMVESEGLMHYAGVDDAVMESRIEEIEDSVDRVDRDDEEFFKRQEEIQNKSRMEYERREL